MSLHHCSISACERPYYAKGFCNLHWYRWKYNGDPLRKKPFGPPPKPLDERFWMYVDKHGPIPEYAPHLGNCWLWTGGKSREGYGHFGVGSLTDGSKRTVLAHRFAYEVLTGPITGGLHLDHLCRVPSCVKPSHLEKVTPIENTQRGNVSVANKARFAAKTHCVRGHVLADNLRTTRNGYRACKTCGQARSREYMRRKREKVSHHKATE